MESCIGIITVRDADYHPNRRLLEAARAAGAAAVLIHPYRLWPATLQGRLEVSGQTPVPRFNVVLPRQGAQIGATCLALIRHFQLTGVPLINDLAAVTTARNKFLTQQALTAAGLPCPDTVFLNDPAGFQEAISALGGYPIVTKPVNARQGEGVLRIGDAEDARRRVLDRLDRERGILIQRYLPPHKRRDFRALVIGGEVIGAATLTPPQGEFRANFHLGSSITAVSLPADLSRLAAAAAQAVGCDVAGVDLMVDADSRPVIVEVNYSPGFNGMEAATGLDIAGRIVRFALRRCRQTGAPQ